MFNAEDEDDTSKVPIVSPNDVIDIEVSSLIRAQASSWLKGFDKTTPKNSKGHTLSISKDEKGRKVKNNHRALKKQEIMKRGDPFLPSVSCDENPVVDFPSKKGAHKKPLDCKCKGMGFNCSPSAVLPEEMRQQWGYGVFGKSAPNGAGSTDTSSETISISSRPIVSFNNNYRVENVTNKTLSNSKYIYGTTAGHGTSPRVMSGLGVCSHVHCSDCKRDQCICTTPKSKHDSFSFSECTEKKRPKLVNKNNGHKIKGSKTQILISSKNNLQTMKTIACINNKENTNIISTSNFNKNNHNSTSFNTFRNGLESDSALIKSGGRISNSGRVNVSQGSSIDSNSYLRGKMYLSPPQVFPDDSDLASCSRYRHRMKTTIRPYVNFRQNPPMATRENSMTSGGNIRFYEPRKFQRVTPTSYMTGSQTCSCDRCRRKAVLLSKMEALGFPSSSAQMTPSPYSYAMSHRYYASSTMPPSSLLDGSRYASCSTLTQNYVSTTGIYCPPSTSYARSSPTFESEPYKSDVYSASSTIPVMSTSRGVNTDACSYVDSEPSLESPLSYSGIVDDITDLSIKDTVDFFMALKSPLADSQRSTFSDDPSPDLFCGPSSEDEAFNCCIGSCACSLKDGGQHTFGHLNDSEIVNNMDKAPSTPPCPVKINNYSDPCPSDAPTQSMSLLYSSLMSNLGLEDELRSAIENIPME